MSVIYRHTQFGTVTIISLALVTLGTTAVVLYVADWVGFVVTGILVLTIFAFGSLTVQVDTDAVRFHFGIGLIRKRYLLTDIEEARVVRNSWLYGWGIRWTPHGWLYNVSGLGAVELRLRSGKNVRIGSDEPEALHAAIQEVLG